MDLEERAGQFTVLIRDPDAKVTRAFDEVFTSIGIRAVKTPVRAPTASAYAERFVGTLRRECADHVLIDNQRHLRRVLKAYQDHDNGHRPPKPRPAPARPRRAR